ncbi:MAG: PIG-L deacetylase family protein [Ktedonobacteraceae bacterium]
MQLTSIEDITSSSRHIFLSPHFDDAVYSCGGTLAVQVSNGLRPLVITVFGGVPAQGLRLSPFAFRIHKEMGVGNMDAADVVTMRRREDANALDYLHVDYLWLDYLDAIYRGNPAYYTEETQLIGGEVHPADMNIDRQLAQDLVALHERLPDAVWYVPLGVGQHVDHQIVASAADRLVQRGANVKFYEDFPYVLESGALENRLNQLGGALEPAYVEMSEMLPQRIEAADMYNSQIVLNFESRANMRQSMQDYTRSIRPVHTIHLERYWTTR